MFMCNACGKTTNSRIKCDQCGAVGRISSTPTTSTGPPSAPVAKSVPTAAPVSQPKALSSQPASPVIAKQTVTAAPPTTMSGVVHASTPASILKFVTGSSPAPDSSSAAPVIIVPPVAATRSARDLRLVVERKFATTGLWARSIQTKNRQCLTDPAIAIADIKSGRKSLEGVFCDAWSLCHQSIAQYFFQMSPDDGKRAVALLLDWEATADRYVDYALSDRSSNKTFLKTDVLSTPDQCAIDMKTMLASLAGSTKSSGVCGHNEIRSIQINNAALVGLVWNPIERPTVFSEGGTTWDDPKTQLTYKSFVKAICKTDARTVPATGLPVFKYSVSKNAGMTLEYIADVAP